MISRTSVMFTFLAVGLASLFYMLWIKWIYYRYMQKWPTSWNDVLNIIVDKETATLSSLERRDFNSRKLEKDVQLSKDVRVLIVTAHPDDECMFFAPTIMCLVQLNISVHLLCLSSGNYYNQGLQRQKELIASCSVLGIPASRVTIVDEKELSDDPKAEWSIALASSLILSHIKAHSIHLVFTFDERGVSGHANHVAIYRALSHLAYSRRIPDGCQAFALHTVSIIRKYLSTLELPISWLLPSCLCCLIGSKDYRRAKEAMHCHRSQLVWFRHLYIVFSRYMFVNTYRPIRQQKKNLKIY